jgi:hypothetical protein
MNVSNYTRLREAMRVGWTDLVTRPWEGLFDFCVRWSYTVHALRLQGCLDGSH